MHLCNQENKHENPTDLLATLDLAMIFLFFSLLLIARNYKISRSFYPNQSNPLLYQAVQAKNQIVPKLVPQYLT